MKVIVDTSVWSLVLRRNSPREEESVTKKLKTLIDTFRVGMLGPIRQELLSGIREPQQFDRLREKLSAFQDIPLQTGDFETAAAFYNNCRINGIQGSNTDFLICAVAFRRGLPIFTTDKDFSQYQPYTGIQLFSAEVKRKT